MISLTETAARNFKRLRDEESPDTPLRVSVKGGGCAGFSYVLDFDKKGATEFDLSYEQHGVNLVIDKKSSFFMMGTELDFNDGLLNRGFVFNNPEATASCGCGTSFSV